MIQYWKWEGRKGINICLGKLLIQIKIIEPHHRFFSERYGYFKGFSAGKFFFIMKWRK